MKNNRTKFLQYPVDNVTLDDVINFVSNAIREDTQHFISVQNANKMYLSKKYPRLENAINDSAIILPENAINIGMRWLGRPLKQRNMGGIHIMEELLKLANQNAFSIYLLGAEETNIIALVKKIKTDYPNIKIVGYRNGYFSIKEEIEIVNTIAESKPNFLFVGLGSPKQEFFIYNNFNKIRANISLGVGGSFNVIAGIETPAPNWTKHGLEWIYRSIQDPPKFKRYLKINSFFIFELFKHMVLSK